MGAGIQTILKDVATQVSENRRRVKTWFDFLSPKEQAELLDTRRAFAAGELSGTVGVVAAAIIKACQARKIKTCGRQGLIYWLKKQQD